MHSYQVSVYIPIGHLVLMMELDNYISSLSSEISYYIYTLLLLWSRGGSVVERPTPVSEVQDSNPHDRRVVSLNKTR